jgi:hypothetical protein
VHVVVKAPAKPLRHCSRSRRRDSSQFLPVIFCAVACAALVSCAVGPDYQPPESPLPAKFAAMSSLKGLGDHIANRPLETTKWWRTLHDRELDSLVSTPEQKCIGWPEQKYISEAGKKAP